MIIIIKKKNGLKYIIDNLSNADDKKTDIDKINKNTYDYI